MKIKFKDYALFNNSNIYELSPLTFLIGGNNCGKTTFVKGLEIIKNGELEGINQVRKGKSEVIASYEVFEGMYRKQTFEIGNDSELIMGRSFVYENKEGKEILSVSYFMGDDSVENVVFHVDRMLLALRDAGLSIKDEMVVQLLSGIKVIKRHIPNRVSKIDFEVFQPDKEIEDLERWFFSIGIAKLLDLSELGADIENKVKQVIIEIFKPYTFEAYLKDETELRRAWNKSRKPFSIRFIKNSDLSVAKRIYNYSDFISEPVSYQLEEKHFTSSAEYYDETFRAHWFKKFFGHENPLSIEPLKGGYFELKLNDRYLIEQGSGITKILQYILFFSQLTANVWDEDRDILFDLDKRQEKIEREMLLIDHRKRQTPNKKRFIYIEEPEVHLHPNFQILLAEMIFELALNSTYHFIIETHSEYLIRKMQLLRAKNKSSTSDLISILNFGSDKNLGKVQSIKIDEFGGLSPSFYPGFLEMNQDLQFQLLKANRSNQN